MADVKDVISRLAAELQRIMRPLTLAGQDERVRSELFDALGWELERLTGFPVTQFAADVVAISSAAISLVTSTETELESFDDLSARLDDIKAIFTALNDLSQLAQSGSLNVSADVRTALAQMGEDLLQFLIVDYLGRYWPGFLHTARLLTLVQTSGDYSTFTPALGGAGGQPPIRRATQLPRVRLDRLGLLITNPIQTLRDEYLGVNGLATEDDATRAASLLFDRLAALFLTFGAHISDGSDTAGEAGRDPKRTLAFRFGFPIDGAIAAFGAITTLTSDMEGGAGIVVVPTGWIDANWDLRRWVATLKASGSVTGITLRRTGPVLPTGTESFSLQLTLERRSDDGTPAIVVGAPKGTRLEFGSVLFGGDLSLAAVSQDFGLVCSLGKSAVVLQGGEGDGFLQKVLPKDGFRIEFDLGIGWTNKKGLYFRGSAALEATLPLHVDLFGILKIDSVFLAIQSKNVNSATGVELIAATSINLKLGPIAASIEKMGLIALLTFPPSGGNLGSANITLGFKPPEGAGLAIDAGAVVGGGYLYFDPDKSQYGGVLQLEVKGGIAIKAIGLITTKMPDGSPGFSFLIIVTVEFTPIQIGFGFSLNGVGGLAGFNRTMRLDPLRDGIKNRTLDSILFPPDPVANAQKIVSDLQTVFPPAPGRFVAAPMVRLGWGGSMLILDIGLAVELPSPLRLAIMGKLHLLLPPITEGGEDEPSLALIELHMDVLGTLDLDKNEFSLDAVLYDSRIVFFTISGGMAMRLRWGDNPVFALAIGGFNPRFTPPPGFPPVERLTLQLSYDKDGFRAGLRLTSYLAVTSNTLQFGARVDVYAEKVGLATVTGYLGFDALIEFSPIHFIIDLYGGVSVGAFGFHFAVDLFLSLSGPEPWIGDGHAIVDFLGKHEIPVHFQIGSEAETPSLPPVNLLERLKVEVEDPRNWSAALPVSGSMLVTLRQLSPDETKGLVLAHPLGELSVRQRVVPFGIALERFGASFPTAPGPFAISQFYLENAQVAAPEVISDAFARGQFVNLTEDQKLSTPAFESFRCGAARIGTDKITSGTRQSAEFVYDVTIIDNKEELTKRSSSQQGSTISPVPLSNDHLWRGAQFGAASQTPMRSTGSAKFAGVAQGIKVSNPKYVITDMGDLSTHGTATFDTYTEAEATHRRDAQGHLQIMETYELKL